MKATQTLMPFFEPLSEGAAFAAYKQRHPEVKAALIAAARHAKERLGVCLDIHAVYSIACEVFGLSCSRDWLPAYAREIAAELHGEGITFKTRPSCYDA